MGDDFSALVRYFREHPDRVRTVQDSLLINIENMHYQDPSPMFAAFTASNQARAASRILDAEGQPVAMEPDPPASVDAVRDMVQRFMQQTRVNDQERLQRMFEMYGSYTDPDDERVGSLLERINVTPIAVKKLEVLRPEPDRPICPRCQKRLEPFIENITLEENWKGVGTRFRYNGWQDVSGRQRRNQTGQLDQHMVDHVIGRGNIASQSTLTTRIELRILMPGYISYQDTFCSVTCAAAFGLNAYLHGQVGSLATQRPDMPGGRGFDL